MQEPPQEPTATGPDGPEGPEQPSGAPTRVRGRKRRFAKRWSRRTSLLVIAAFSAIVISFFNIDIGRISIFGGSIKSAAEKYGSKYLERPLHIGKIVAYVSQGRFGFEDVVIEGPTKDDRPFFAAKHIFVNVPWWTIFRKDLYIDIDVYEWGMVVEKFPDGQVHLPKLVHKPKEGEKSGGFPLKIRSLSVLCHDGQFLYDDHVTPWSVKGPNLQFSLVRANNLDTYVGIAQFTKGQVKIQNFETMSADFSTRFQIKGPLVDLKHIDLVTDGAETHLNGYVSFGNWPEQEYRIQSTLDFNRMRELFFAKAEWRMSGQGRFNGIFKIAKNGKYDLSGLFKSDEAGLGIKNSEWRFGDLDGELQWTPDRFIVKRADSDFLGGRMKLTYGLDPLGKPGGSTATLSADYTNVNLYLFTRQFGFTALEPQGRMRGQVSMEWHNGQFVETMQGKGVTAISPPAGESIATELLPALAPPIKHEEHFQKYIPFGEFAIGGDTSYRFSWTDLDFDNSWVATPTTFVNFSGHARGGDVHVPFHVTSHDWQNSDRLFTAIMSNFNHPVSAIEVGGRGTFDGTLTKAFNAPRIEGHFDGDRMRAWGSVWGRATGDVVIENQYLDVANGRIAHGETGSIVTHGRYALGYPRADGGDEINATIRVQDIPLEALRYAFQMKDWPVEGQLAAADLTLRGQYERPGGSGTMRIERGTAWSEPFDAASADLRFGGDGSVSLQRVVVEKGEGRVTGTASLSWVADTFVVSAIAEKLDMQELSTFQFERAPLTGQLAFKADGFGSYDTPTWVVKDLLIPDLYAGGEGVGSLRGQIQLANRIVTFQQLEVGSERLQAGCQGTIALIDLYDASLRCHFEDTSLDPYFKFVGRDLPFNRAIASGNFAVSGPLLDARRLSVTAHVLNTQLTLFDYTLTNDQSIDLSFHDNTFWLDRVNFKGEGTGLQLKGQANLTSRTLGIQASGSARLAVLRAFYPSLNADGTSVLTANMTGTFDAPELGGSAELKDGYIRSAGVPSLSAINGRIIMSGDRISVDGVSAMMGEGPVLFTGGIILDGYRPSRFDLHATGSSLHMHYPQGLQSTVNATLDMLGPIGAPVLSGNVTVLRASYTLRVDPSRGYFGFFGGGTGDELPVGGAVEIEPAFPIALNIRIHAGTMPFVDNKNANALIVGSANALVTGTINQPIITGRVEIDHGRWTFTGNRYTLLGGSIDFSNPTSFDPFFDVTAETDARATGQTYHVTVRITGTLAKLGATFNSEPWLSETQTISLLMGEAPAVGAVELRALSATQDEQAKALSSVGLAFITSPISSTVGGAIQKATTLNTQIVPMLNSESTLQQLNPTARIVLGRAVSSRVYVTYSRTLSGSQNEIILVEIQQDDRVSWVLSRNEDKTFAVDFRFRYVIR